MSDAPTMAEHPPQPQAPTGGQVPARVRVRDLHIGFGERQVLSGTGLAVAPGESLVVLGGSGSGKSVLLKCILGLLQAQKGSIEIDGHNLETMDRRRRNAACSRIGMLFQNAALFDSLSVWENVAFGLIEGRGMARRDAAQIAHEKLAQVGLDGDVAERYPAELSGGMRKRVALARAIAGDPDIVFFDEPTTGLDPIMGHVIDDLIVKCVRDSGASAISITHDIASARRIADRMAMLYDGRIIWDGHAGEIDHCDNAYVRQFIAGSVEGPIPVTAMRA